MSVLARQEVECRIAFTIIAAALAKGYTVSVNDGEEEVLTKSSDPFKITSAMMSTDDDTLSFFDKKGKDLGWVAFIYGNDGHDVVHDYTNTRAIRAIVKSADKIAKRYGDGDHRSDAVVAMKEIFPIIFGKPFKKS